MGLLQCFDLAGFTRRQVGQVTAGWNSLLSYWYTWTWAEWFSFVIVPAEHILSLYRLLPNWVKIIIVSIMKKLTYQGLCNSTGRSSRILQQVTHKAHISYGGWYPSPGRTQRLHSWTLQTQLPPKTAADRGTAGSCKYMHDILINPELHKHAFAVINILRLSTVKEGSPWLKAYLWWKTLCWAL